MDIESKAVLDYAGPTISRGVPSVAGDSSLTIFSIALTLSGHDQHQCAVRPMRRLSRKQPQPERTVQVRGCVSLQVVPGRSPVMLRAGRWPRQISPKNCRFVLVLESKRLSRTRRSFELC